MLYINGKDLFSLPENDPVRRKYDEVLERLEKAKVEKDDFAVKFRVKDGKITTQYTDKGRQLNTCPAQHVSYEKTVTEKDEKGRNRRVQYVYSEEPLPEEGGKADVSKAKPGKWMFLQNKVEETVRDADLAFFLYHVDRKFGEAQDNAIYYLIDERSEAEKKVERGEKDVEFQYIIYARTSPLRESRDKLVTVAQAWGVEDAADKEDPVLLTELENVVKKGEREKKDGKTGARGIEEFINDTNLGFETELMATVQKAFDQGIIGLNEKPNQLGVYWLNNNGEPTTKLVGLTPKTIDNWRYRTMKFFAHPSHEGQLNMVKSELGIATPEEEENAGEELDLDDFFGRFYDKDMKSKVYEVARNVGIQPVAKKKEKLEAELREYFGYPPREDSE